MDDDHHLKLFLAANNEILLDMLSEFREMVAIVWKGWRRKFIRGRRSSRESSGWDGKAECP